MRLTSYSDYALRILMYLAVMPESNTLVTITDIADSYQISKSHLTKIVHQLAQLGYIESVRGKNGGICLAMAANDINLGQILRHTEADFAVVPCFESGAMNSSITQGKPLSIASKTRCAINSSCQLKALFYEATQAFIAVMDNYTLADITQNDHELRQLLF